MRKLTDAWFVLVKIIAVLCLALMVILVFGNVVLRYGFNSGITFSEEAARLLFLYATFLGAILALRENLHLGIDSVVSRLQPAARKVCLIVSQALMLYATWLLLVGSWEQAVINVNTKSPVTGLSMAAVYGVGIIFGVSTGVMLVSRLIRVLMGRLSDEDVSRALGVMTAQPRSQNVDKEKSLPTKASIAGSQPAAEVKL
jgi:TRAP-type C4-dicarboxylate transport system permease small subunit